MNSEEESKKVNDLTSASDSALYAEVANRLRTMFRKKHGLDFKNGFFAFVIHRGRFQGVEENFKSRMYYNPEIFPHHMTEGEET